MGKVKWNVLLRRVQIAVIGFMFITPVALFLKPGDLPEFEHKFQKYQVQYPDMTHEVYENVWFASERYDMSISNILAVINAESQFDRYAYSSAEARGLMQVIAKYWYKTGNPHDLYTPMVCIMVGTKALRWCWDMSKHNFTICLKNYNSGPYNKYINWPYIYKIKDSMTYSEILIAAQ